MERERGKEMYPGQSRNCLLSLFFCRQISFLREQNNLGKSSHWAQLSFACLQMDPQRIFLSALMVLVFITQGRDFQDYLNEKFCREGAGGAKAFHLNKLDIFPFYFTIIWLSQQTIRKDWIIATILPNCNSSTDQWAQVIAANCELKHKHLLFWSTFCVKLLFASNLERKVPTNFPIFITSKCEYCLAG